MADKKKSSSEGYSKQGRIQSLAHKQDYALVDSYGKYDHAPDAKNPRQVQANKLSRQAREGVAWEQ